MKVSNISQWEFKAAQYVENQLNLGLLPDNPNKTRVVLWADAFNTNENPNKKVQIFLGHQKTERDRVGTKFYTQGTQAKEETVYLNRYFVEIMVEIFTIKNHQSALDLIEFVLDEVLNDFRPFYEFTKFIIGESGGVQRNEKRQSWIYRGEGYTEIMSDTEELTSTLLPLPMPKIISIGVYNSDEQAIAPLIGTFRQQ